MSADQPHGLQRMEVRERRGPKRNVGFDSVCQGIESGALGENTVHRGQRRRIDQGNAGNDGLADDHEPTTNEMIEAERIPFIRASQQVTLGL